MKIPAAHILKQFVDRTREIAGFESLLSGSPKRVMCVSGPGGIGKSLLISRMIQECVKREFRWVYIEWEDSRRYNYLDIMRKIRDGTDASLFQLFNDRVNFYTVRNYTLQMPLEVGTIQDVHVLSGGEIQQAGVTVHVGHKVEIKDLNVNMPRPDRDVTENEVVIESTHAFIPCLRGLTSQSPLVVFLDALEKTDELAMKWIWEELLERVRDQEIPNLLAILAGRVPFEPDPTFFDCTEVFELRPFKTDDILEYLVRRGLERKDDVAEFILANFGGNPLQIAMSVNNYIRLQSQKQTNA